MLVFAGAAAPALAAPNLLPSGGFEGGAAGSLAGWKGIRAVLTLRPDGRGGGHAARVARAAGARTYSIVAAPNPAAAVAERRYRASAYLRSGRPGRTVCLKLIELTPAGRVAGQAMGCHKATAAWRALPVVSYTAKHTGNAISLRVVQTSAASAGDSFQVDALQLTAPGSDAIAPSAPTALSAQAASSTKVVLSWHAATDNTGVAGYTVYRGGAAIATVFGTVSGYTDGSAAAGKTYVYAVDAFDASGNRSARTKGVSVTMPSPGDPVIAAAGDIACDPTAGDIQRRQGQRIGVHHAGDVRPDRGRPVHRGRARAGRRPVRMRRLHGLPGVVRHHLGPVPGQDPPGAGQPRVPDERRQRLRAGRGRVLPATSAPPPATPRATMPGTSGRGT